MIRAMAFGAAVLVALTTTPARADNGNKVLVIWLENKSYSQIVGSPQAPYLNSLPGAALTQSYGITHPSAPNYIGATFGVPLSQLPATDCTNCKQAGPSIFSQGESWGVYQESMTKPCATTKSADGLYVPRHNPATYSSTLLANGQCKAHDLPLTSMPSVLPEFTFVTPNLNHDMHSASITSGDAWLRAFLSPILASSDYQSGVLTVVVTFDEGSGGGSHKGEDCAATSSQDCHIPTWVMNTRFTTTTLSTRVSGYDVLATEEDLLGLPVLGEGVSFLPLLVAS